jgi:hypothetical protein
MTDAGPPVLPVVPYRAEWRNIARYPCADVTLDALAWEYLRRNQRYSEDFESLLSAALGGGTELELHELHRPMQKRWHVKAMVYPGLDRPPLWHQHAEPSWPGDASEGESGPIVPFTFRVDRPLTRQFAAAELHVRQRARAWMASHSGAPTLAPINRDWRWHRNVLRARDGFAAGASRREIAAELWPGWDEEVQRNRVRYAIDRGRELVSAGYLSLAFAASAADGDLQDAGETSGPVLSPFFGGEISLSSNEGE